MLRAKCSNQAIEQFHQENRTSTFQLQDKVLANAELLLLQMTILPSLNLKASDASKIQQCQQNKHSRRSAKEIARLGRKLTLQAGKPLVRALEILVNSLQLRAKSPMLHQTRWRGKKPLIRKLIELGSLNAKRTLFGICTRI